MIHGILMMTKSTLRLLIRNKGFLFFAIVLPLLSTLILNISMGDSADENDAARLHVKLETPDSQMAYLEDQTRFSVKLYNQDGTESAEKLMKMLASYGIFQIFEADASEMSEKEIADSAASSVMQDKIDAVAVVRSSFTEQVEQHQVTDSVEIYSVGSDDRYSLFETALETSLYRMVSGSETTAGLTEVKAIKLETVENNSGDSFIDLACAPHKISIFGNVIALYTVAFLFAGIMILGTIISERDNLVYTRIMLSRATAVSYILSKLLVVVISALIQTIVATIGFMAFVNRDIGMNYLQFAYILFQMALIFNFMSVGIGVCFKNVLSASLGGFTIWMISAVLSGLYFDISASAESYKRIAILFPERWAMQAASRFIEGQNSGYPILFLITLMYLIVILLVGVVGLKITKRE